MEEVPGSGRSRHSYIWPTPGFKCKTCQLRALNRGDLNVHIHMSHFGCLPARFPVNCYFMQGLSLLTVHALAFCLQKSFSSSLVAVSPDFSCIQAHTSSPSLSCGIPITCITITIIIIIIIVLATTTISINEITISILNGKCLPLWVFTMQVQHCLDQTLLHQRKSVWKSQKYRVDVSTHTVGPVWQALLCKMMMAN